MHFETLARYGRDDLAILTVARVNGRVIECAESLQPPLPRNKKWVLILSSLYGCPVGCRMCDAGEYYEGPLEAEAMFAQLDHLVTRRFPDRVVPVEKFKVQFARIGEPALNPAVLRVVASLPRWYDAPGLIPCVSTVAPAGCEGFLEELGELKNSLFPGGRFQLQFSIHSSDDAIRRRWMTSGIWSLEQIAAFGHRWHRPGDRKVTLNFAVARDSVIHADVLRNIFDPDRFIIKLTPVNPTLRAGENRMESAIPRGSDGSGLPIVRDLKAKGFQVIPSVGEWEENSIGTNCGQFATRFHNGRVTLKPGYTSREYLLPG